MKVLVVLCLMVTCAHALVGKECHVESDCDAGECCQILSRFPVVSKRQDLLHVFPAIGTSQDAGTCQVYKVEGDHCDSFEHMNGYCGCGPNLTCHGEEVKITSIGREIHGGSSPWVHLGVQMHSQSHRDALITHPVSSYDSV